MKKSIIGEDLKQFVNDNIKDIAESHIECWKDRYYRKSKSDIKFDLEVNCDNSGEIENAQEQLKRELTDKEADYLISKFIKEVVRAIY